MTAPRRPVSPAAPPSSPAGAARDEAELLARLVEAWRETHDPALEEPIARLGEQVARPRPAIAAKTKREIEARWHALAEQRDPGDLDRLLDTPWPKRRPDIVARVLALATWPADPRIGPKVLRLRGHYPAGELDIVFGALLAQSPSAQLERMLDGYGEYRFGRARAALALVRRTACDPALLAEAEAALAKRATPVVPATLLAESLAHPEDLALRRVLADELQELGDPRGELIALQLAVEEGTADKRTHDRIEAILAANLDRWIAPLPNIVAGSCRFERGFLVALTSMARGRTLDASIDRPAWATVEELTIDGRDADVPALIRRMPHLRTLVTRDEVLAQLAKAGPFPTIVALGTAWRWMLARRAPFPNLRVLAGQWARGWPEETFDDDCTELQGAAAKLALDAIVHVKILAEQVAPLLAIARHLGPPETRFTLGGEQGRGWLVAIPRDAPRAHLSWGGGTQRSREQIETLLVDLAEAGVRDVAVHADARAREAVEYTLRNRRKRVAMLTLRFDAAPLDLAAPIDRG